MQNNNAYNMNPYRAYQMDDRQGNLYWKNSAMKKMSVDILRQWIFDGMDVFGTRELMRGKKLNLLNFWVQDNGCCK